MMPSLGRSVRALTAVAFLAATPSAATQEPPASPIGFTRSTSGRSVIFTIRPDGTDETRVSPATGWSTDPELSPGGTALAYGRSLSTYVVEPDGSNRRLLEDNGYDATWSPDGERLLFQRYKVDSDVRILRINSDGSGLRQLTRGSITYEPAWSPDASRIVFVRDRDLPRLWTMNPDGSGKRALTHASGKEDAAPTFSPDGRKVLFTRSKSYGYRCLYRSDVFVIAADGSRKARNLTRTCRRRESSPEWSPDGTKIVFTEGGIHGLQIHVMNADGTGVRQLTNGPGRNQWPVWSPDGTQIAFISNRDGNSELYVMNATGGDETRLTTTPRATESQPTW
jgi:Tol biopolymer transport system component